MMMMMTMMRFQINLSIAVILVIVASTNCLAASISDFDDLDSFLSDLPSKGSDIASHVDTSDGQSSTTTEVTPTQCFRNNRPMVFPPNLFSNKSAHYPFQESGLQIFLGMKIPCDGVITAWQFLSAHTVIWGLHFGVFRRTCFDVLQLVSDTYINGQTTGTVEEKWVAWKPASPIPVKRGDVIGIFYDHVNTATKSVAVRSVTLPDNYKYAPKQFSKSEALVYLYDAQTLAKSHGCVRLQSGRVTRRIPALFILMTPEVRGRLVPAGSRTLSPNSNGEDMPTTTTAITSTTSTNNVKDIHADSLVPLNGAQDCNQLPKFDYSCDTSLGVRYYFDKISKVCRQFLFCPSNSAASSFGFGSQADCLMRCSPSPLSANNLALPIKRDAAASNNNNNNSNNKTVSPLPRKGKSFNRKATLRRTTSANKPKSTTTTATTTSTSTTSTPSTTTESEVYDDNIKQIFDDPKIVEMNAQMPVTLPQAPTLVVRPTAELTAAAAADESLNSAKLEQWLSSKNADNISDDGSFPRLYSIGNRQQRDHHKTLVEKPAAADDSSWNNFAQQLYADQRQKR